MADRLRQQLAPIAPGEDVGIPFDGASAADPTSWTFLFALRHPDNPDPDDPDLSTTAVVVSGVEEQDDGSRAATFTATLSRAETLTLTPAEYRFDLWRTTAPAGRVRLAAGRVVVSDSASEGA